MFASLENQTAAGGCAGSHETFGTPLEPSGDRAIRLTPTTRPGCYLPPPSTPALENQTAVRGSGRAGKPTRRQQTVAASPHFRRAIRASQLRTMSHRPLTEERRRSSRTPSPRGQGGRRGTGEASPERRARDNPPGKPRNPTGARTPPRAQAPAPPQPPARSPRAHWTCRLHAQPNSGPGIGREPRAAGRLRKRAPSDRQTPASGRTPAHLRRNPLQLRPAAIAEVAVRLWGKGGRLRPTELPGRRTPAGEGRPSSADGAPVLSREGL